MCWNKHPTRHDRAGHSMLIWRPGPHPSTCSWPFFTPSRNPCSSRALLLSTNRSRMQASRHQVNCGWADTPAQSCLHHPQRRSVSGPPRPIAQARLGARCRMAHRPNGKPQPIRWCGRGGVYVLS